MDIGTWLNNATTILKNQQIVTARLDSLILLEDATKKDRAWLLAHPEFEIKPSQLSELTKKIKRRANHEPLAYIREKSHFYGREFKVTPATLQPRAETETMVDLFKSFSEEINTIADIGTGSGCIAITIKLEFPKLTVLATEVNNDALNIAKINSKKLKADVNFFKGNLIKPIIKIKPTPDTLLCNLPYVPSSHTINKAAMQEPEIAIFGGDDGLDLYRDLFAQLSGFFKKPQYIFSECLPFQHNLLKEIAKTAGYNLIKVQDFIQVFIKVD